MRSFSRPDAGQREGRPADAGELRVETDVPGTGSVDVQLLGGGVVPDDGLLAVPDEDPQAEPVGAAPVQLGDDVQRLAVVPGAAQVTDTGDVQPTGLVDGGGAELFQFLHRCLDQFDLVPDGAQGQIPRFALGAPPGEGGDLVAVLPVVHPADEWLAAGRSVVVGDRGVEVVTPVHPAGAVRGRRRRGVCQGDLVEQDVPGARAVDDLDRRGSSAQIRDVPGFPVQPVVTEPAGAADHFVVHQQVDRGLTGQTGEVRQVAAADEEVDEVSGDLERRRGQCALGAVIGLPAVDQAGANELRNRALAGCGAVQRAGCRTPSR